jgi:spermidine/putrescine transport system substrate-binding protein
MAYSVPYTVTITCLGVLGGKVPDSSPGACRPRRPQGPLTLLNDHRETIGAALKFLGHSLNTTNDAELAAAQDVVLRWKKKWPSSRTNSTRPASRPRIPADPRYSGDSCWCRARTTTSRCRAGGGHALSFDDMAIPADARQVTWRMLSSISSSIRAWPPN